jgi:hypothetical protein
MVNNNFIPVDFVIFDIKCNACCLIVLGRPFLRASLFELLGAFHEKK